MGGLLDRLSRLCFVAFAAITPILAAMTNGATMTGVSTRPGLYVHVPFCSSVCPYCDFAVTLAGEERRAEWERGLLDEAAMYADCEFVFDTVYFGGGTPSTLNIERLERLVCGLRRRLRIDPAAQYFIETNPEDVTLESASRWREIGFSSVSVGVQSLDDASLEFLGRHHTGKQARLAVDNLLAAGFRTVSLDLIFGLPGQRRSDWVAQLQQAADLGVNHLSCYQLTIHQGTVFGRRLQQGLIREMNEGPQADLYAATHDVVHKAGFEAYEVSNFARPGHRSAHNSKYWFGAPYLGLGPGAHSFDGAATRWWNQRKLRIWQRAVDEGLRPIDDEEQLTGRQRALEMVMLGLRTSDGVDLGAVERQFAVDVIEPNIVALRELQARGLIRRSADVVAPTPAGMAVADSLARSIEVDGR